MISSTVRALVSLSFCVQNVSACSTVWPRPTGRLLRQLLGSLSKDFFERRMSNGSGLFELLGRDFEQIIGHIVSIRVKTLSNTNLVAYRHIKREKGSFLVNVLRSKRRCLNALISYKRSAHCMF